MVRRRSRGLLAIVNKFLSYSISILLITAFLFTVQTKSAHAYIDLGLGSYMLQLLMATLLASLFMVKVYWGKFTEQISRLFERFKATDAESD